ncbi:hypothetical protein ACQY0O_004000 [Thecaphora frezii]
MPKPTTVTPLIAHLLSERFGVRHSYVSERASTATASLPSASGRIRLDAIVIDLDGDPSSDVRPNDVVVIPATSAQDERAKFLLVTKVTRRDTAPAVASGLVLVDRIDTILGRFGDRAELFATRQRLSTPLASIGYRARRGTFSLRFAFDETRPAFVSLDEWMQTHCKLDRVDNDANGFRYVVATRQHAAGFRCCVEGPDAPVEAHQGDFIYLLPDTVASVATRRSDDDERTPQRSKGGPKPFSVCRVEKVIAPAHASDRCRASSSTTATDQTCSHAPEVILRFFDRQALLSPLPRHYAADGDTLASLWFRDEKRLMPTQRTVRLDLACHRVVGRCYVSTHAETAQSTDNHFYVRRKDLLAVLGTGELDSCPACRSASDDAATPPPRLSCLDLFCGAGGLSIGLALSGTVQTRWAVDHDRNSIDTFRRHHPKSTAICGDASALLASVIRRTAAAQHLPERGKVDLIAGGPPCQGFTGLNRISGKCKDGSRPPDGRNLLVANLLSWVDVYQPKFVLVENVVGLLNANLGEHDRGFVKFVLLALLAMGYGASVELVQSGSYGSPQSRRRVIVWGARIGLHLPRIPPATHVFLGQPANTFTWSDGRGKVYHSLGRDRTQGAAPLPAVTIGDAICDLPRFDWIDPHLVYPETAAERVARRRRAKSIPALWAAAVGRRSKGKTKAVGSRLQRYAAPARTSYQLAARHSADEAGFVSQHQTRRLGGVTVERVVNVPLCAGANHQAWLSHRIAKPRLAPWGMQSSRSARAANAFYRNTFARLSYHSHFEVALTTMSPTGECGKVLHPSQHRILTVREHARAQGFPDHVEFATDKNLGEAHRQIGNAVAVPLARALGRALRIALGATSHEPERMDQGEASKRKRKRHSSVQDGKRRIDCIVIEDDD